MEKGTSLEESKQNIFRLKSWRSSTALSGSHTASHRDGRSDLPHQCGPQTFVEPPDALRLEEFFCNLCSRHSSWCRNDHARIVRATEHCISGHKLCGSHHDWFLLLDRCTKKTPKTTHIRYIIINKCKLLTLMHLKRALHASYQVCLHPVVVS